VFWLSFAEVQGAYVLSGQQLSNTNLSPHKYGCLGVFLGGKALPKNGRTTARMGLYFLALKQRKGTG